ncbi:hypothetical protein M3Y99_00180700 [Aphelenchoides fujianensis]|nr:hypothetical protein M3Y99_00180700 [Aphelenchoides fujianensis]
MKACTLRAVRLLNQQLTSKYSKHLHTLRVHQRAFISISLIALNGSEELRGYMSMMFGIFEAVNSSITHHEIRVYTRKMFGRSRKTSTSFARGIPTTPRASRSSVGRKASRGVLPVAHP